VTRQQRGEENATYCFGDTLWLMLVWQLVIMVMSIMLQIHRDEGVAAGVNGDVDHGRDP
jgi:ABC-type sugar transport system permease subunit